MAFSNEGITSKEAQDRIEKFGPNKLPEKPPPSSIKIFLSQFKSPLVYILLAASGITALLGHFSDTTVIMGAVLVNTILGFFQERKAGRALYQLKKIISPISKIIRGGVVSSISSEQIVPGDLVILTSGDKIPADGKIIVASRFYVNESVLTGESLPVTKNIGDEVFMGTFVTAGNCRMEVSVTGANTEVGKIAVSVQEPSEDTPLKKQLKKFSQDLTYLVLGLTAFVFVAGLFTGKEIVEIFTISVALAVSSIPEGLLVGLTVVLAIGMQRILKRKGLVRKLVSAETLGGVTTICVDKTGTLTEGKMRVEQVLGDKEKIIEQVLIANDMDDPILIASWEWASKEIKMLNLAKEEFIKGRSRLDSIPFDPNDRFFASLNKGKSGNEIFVNGAPDYILNWCKIEPSEKKKIQADIERLTSEGRRLIGLARKTVSDGKSKIDTSDIKNDLDWVGLLAFVDPVRSSVKEAFSKARQAGIKIIVITGDYAQTAQSVMNELDIKVTSETTITGDRLEKINQEELALILKKREGTILFARTTPAQKEKIVDALKKNGEVVAMMGDGVNDAPALNKADIGIVVNDASDVSKETADLVLLDSNFATIIAAVEEGRGIFDNIRKIILYLMSDAFEEIIAVIGTIILGIILSVSLPLPISALQILWINIVSDGLPHLALTIDPKVEGIMSRAPRSSHEQIVNGWMKMLIVVVSLCGGIAGLVLFCYYYWTYSDIRLAQSVTFAALGANSLFYVFSVRNLGKPFWRENPFKNKWLNISVAIGLILQIAPFYIPPLRDFLGVVRLDSKEYLVIFSISFGVFIIIEFLKKLIKVERYIV